jgi:hypothetical protein
MVELNRWVAPACLSLEFLKDKSFQELSQHGAIFEEEFGVYTEQSRGKTCISKMQLGRFDETAQSVAVPRRQMFQQKYP